MAAPHGEALSEFEQLAWGVVARQQPDSWWLHDLHSHEGRRRRAAAPGGQVCGEPPSPQQRHAQARRPGLIAGGVQMGMPDAPSWAERQVADCVRRRLEVWTRLSDGRFQGYIGGQTLWTRPASVEEKDGRPVSIRDLNGARYELGARPATVDASDPLV